MNNFDIRIYVVTSVSMSRQTALDFSVCVTTHYRRTEDNALQPNCKRNALSMSKGMLRYSYWQPEILDLVSSEERQS